MNEMPQDDIVSTPSKRVFSEDHRRRISEARKGQKLSPEGLEKRRQSLSGFTRGPHSEATREKISAAQRGRKQSPEHREKNRLSHVGLPGTRVGAHHTEEAKQKLREARLAQIHPALSLQGVTLEQLKEATSQGLLWCGGICRKFVAKELFGKNTQMCKPCNRLSCAKQRASFTDERKAEIARETKQWRTDNAEQVRRVWIKRKYGVTPEWYENKLTEQEGHCALCEALVDGRRFTWEERPRQYLLIDHNHDTGMVRGLLCAKCNTALHRVEYTKDWATKAVAYLVKYAIPAPLAASAVVE